MKDCGRNAISQQLPGAGSHEVDQGLGLVPHVRVSMSASGLLSSAAARWAAACWPPPCGTLHKKGSFTITAMRFRTLWRSAPETLSRDFRKAIVLKT